MNYKRYNKEVVYNFKLRRKRNKRFYEGRVYKTKDGYVKILRYITFNKVLVKLLTTGETSWQDLSRIKSGKILLNKNR
jgi:hypothetical protein